MGWTPLNSNPDGAAERNGRGKTYTNTKLTKTLPPISWEYIPWGEWKMVYSLNRSSVKETDEYVCTTVGNPHARKHTQNTTNPTTS